MQGFFVLSFIFLTSYFALPGQASALGGERPIADYDKENVQKAKKMVTQDVKEKYGGDEGYETTSIVFSDWYITRKVVNGMVYNMKWKTTYNYAAIICDLEDKPSKTENWRASVWFKAGGGGQQYATGGEPKCVDCY